MNGNDFLIKALLERLNIKPEVLKQINQLPQAISQALEGLTQSQARIETALQLIEARLQSISLQIDPGAAAECTQTDLLVASQIHS